MKKNMLLDLEGRSLDYYIMLFKKEKTCWKEMQCLRFGAYLNILRIVKII